ncbi:hypothetical protein HID58_054858 [Brassica napus]|uniref:Uncharacterized protein n=1 Tax=Brassica napus TaxID=3708 RepID=A0ABQ8AIT7_BRANA|nr:hypothetical protein HID58_054858 [Brassica napus]
MDLGDLETIQVSGKPRMKVEFTLRDMNDARVPCCLWGKFAEILYEGCSIDEEGKPICLIRFAKIGRFRGIRLLQSINDLIIRFVDEVKTLAICEGRDETLDLEEVKSIQDKRDKWMLFPKRTIHGLLESTQVCKENVSSVSPRLKLHLIVKDDTGETKLMLLDQIAKGMIVESAATLLNGSFDENSVNLLDNEEHIEGLSTPSTKRKGAWSDPPRDITSTSKNLR